MGLLRGVWNFSRSISDVFKSGYPDAPVGRRAYHQPCALFEVEDEISVPDCRPFEDKVKRLAPSFWHSSALDTTPAGRHGEEVRTWQPSAETANLAASVVTSTMNHRDDSPEPEGGLLDGNEYHHILLDIDHPAALIPSTTPDHAHLYVKLKHSVRWPEYLEFLRACEKVGLIDKRYVDHSEKRRMTMCRLPWIRKLPRIGGGFSAGYDEAETP